MDIGRPFYRARVKMRRHFGIEDLGDGGKLLGLQNATQTAEGGLQDLDATSPQQSDWPLPYRAGRDQAFRLRAKAVETIRV